MKHLLLLTLICFGATATAQLRLGLKLGAGTFSITEQQLNILDPGGLQRFGLAMEEAHYSIHGGLVLQARIKRFLLFQPEILLQSNTTEYRVEDFSTPGSEPRVLSEKFQYLNFPVLLGLQFGPLRLHAGPQGHVFLSSRSDLSTLDGYKEDFKEMTFSWLAGIGLDVWKSLMLDIRYEGSLTRFGDHITFFGTEYPFEHRQARVLLSLGILFGKKV